LEILAEHDELVAGTRTMRDTQMMVVSCVCGSAAPQIPAHVEVEDADPQLKRPLSNPTTTERGLQSPRLWPNVGESIRRRQARLVEIDHARPTAHTSHHARRTECLTMVALTEGLRVTHQTLEPEHRIVNNVDPISDTSPRLTYASRPFDVPTFLHRLDPSVPHLFAVRLDGKREIVRGG
jgi:hypothetical protein